MLMKLSWLDPTEWPKWPSHGSANKWPCKLQKLGSSVISQVPVVCWSAQQSLIYQQPTTEKLHWRCATLQPCAGRYVRFPLSRCTSKQVAQRRIKPWCAGLATANGMTVHHSAKLMTSGEGHKWCLVRQVQVVKHQDPNRGREGAGG